MAIQSINTIKNWFKTGLKPTQAQFWDWLDSFRHKSDKVPVAEIEGINELLLAKASADILNSHLSDPSAHSQLLIKSRIIPVGEFLVFKVLPNENQFQKEPGDYCFGVVGDTVVNGTWNGLDASDLNNFV
jgi:hypothetical protein